jgi:effector-binding domain-containing protein
MKQISTQILIGLILTVSFTTQKSLAMEKKNLEKVNVFMFTLQSSLATMGTDIGDITDQMIAKANELGLEITGPQIWQYTGSDGKPDTKFKLDICLPIKEAKGDAGKFKFGVLPETTVVSEIHNGAWDKLGNTYMKVIGEMTRKAMFPTMVTREVYTVCDFVHPENCVTEIQIEIQK